MGKRSNTAAASICALALVLVTGIAPPPQAGLSPASSNAATGPFAAAIDSTWGEGLPVARKLEIFDTFWATVDERFASFEGVEHVDWMALRNRYRPEVAAGVSRGRFAAIMNHLAMALRDSHTIAIDQAVNLDTLPVPGVPLLWLGPWLNNTFGACTTAQSDGSALIVEVSPSHPLGLQPGDQVLGFEGRRWAELYPELIEAELPLYHKGTWGSSPASFHDTWIASGPLNWHLFNSIDVLKHDSGLVQHVPTAGLGSLPDSGICSEQPDIPGVAKPLWTATTPLNAVTWGLLPGTNIGYVYVWCWCGDAGPKFTQAMQELTQQLPTDGLILDFRFNSGGNMFLSDPGLAMLFDEPTPTISFDIRKRPNDHFEMKPGPESQPSFYVIDNNLDPRSYGKPIAVLTGPGCVSSGDQVALRMTYHPHARVFGKTTATAFDAPSSIDLDQSWFGSYAEFEAHRINTPHQYLTHDEFPIDESVWLTPDDAAAGRDTVAAAAVEWIDSMS